MEIAETIGAHKATDCVAPSTNGASSRRQEIESKNQGTELVIKAFRQLGHGTTLVRLESWVLQDNGVVGRNGATGPR